MPEDKSWGHHETHEVRLELAERIVAARIDVNNLREDPCVI